MVPGACEMAEKHSRKSITIDFKRKVLKVVEDNPKRKKVDIAKEFNITPTTLATIIKNKDKYGEETGLHDSRKRSKKGELQDVEDAVIMWLKQCRDKNIPISGPVLQEKAQHFAEQLSHPDFRASNGWLDRFKKRHEVTFKKVCGESAAVDDGICEDWKNKLADLTQGYHQDDIYNADETGLFFRCLPDKTLTFKGDPCNGGKNSKERLTVLLGANSSGTNKLKPLIIGKSEKPRCFKNVKKLPTHYISNKKAWMNGKSFSDWLIQINNEMKKKKKKILLFIDNCSAHGDIPKLSNVKVQFLPPNTTSKLQPLDQGIIKNFKTNYRREMVRKFLNDLERQTSKKINVLDAMWMVIKAWKNVTETTIANCFRKSGFKVNNPDQDEEDDLEDLQPLSNLIEGCWPTVQESLNIDMDFEEFVNFDNELAVCGELSEAEILATVTGDGDANAGVPEEEDEDEDVGEDEPDPTMKDVREALHVLKCFFLKKSDLSESVVKSITELDCALDAIKLNAGKQSKIDDFFSHSQAGTSSTVSLEK